MLSDIVEKKIDDVSAISDELSHIVPRDGWTAYAVGLVERLQRLAIILDDEDEAAEARLDEILSEFNTDDGNTRLPFGLCEREGIKIDPSWTPRDAWAALEKKGYNVSKTYNELEKNGTVASEGSDESKKRFSERHAVNDRIRKALKSKPNELVLFSGCHQKNEDGEVVKKSQEVAREYAENSDGATMEMLLERDKEVLSQWNMLDMNRLSQWEEGSRVLAEQASGEVRVVVKGKPGKNSIFMRIELPTLMKNANVTSVVLIDMDTGKKKELFRRQG